MEQFQDKVAVITGGASGIGLAMAQAFAGEGMKIVIADVEQEALDKAVEGLKAGGADAMGHVTDVSDFESVQALEAAAREAHGNVHVLCNNAGVGAQEDIPLWELPINDWAWTLSVNLWGVIHGVKAFLGNMMAHGEPGHVINTSSSNGGLTFIPNTPIYATSKAGVSALTEVLHQQLLMHGSAIKASILYPGPHLVTSNIFTASRNRPDKYEREVEQVMPPFTLETVQMMVEAAGLSFDTTAPEEVALQVLEAVKADQFYILPFNEQAGAQMMERFGNIMARNNPPLPDMMG